MTLNWLFVIGMDFALGAAVAANFYMSHKLRKAGRVQADTWDDIRTRDLALHQRELALERWEINLVDRAKGIERYELANGQPKLVSHDGMNDIIRSLIEMKETKH